MIVDYKTTELGEIEPLSLLKKRILRERRKKSLFRLCLKVMITSIVVLVLFGFVAGIAIVQGDSMKPSLTNGSLALFYRLNDTYERSDIVIFKPTNKDEILIKRVVAVEGDTVDIDNETGKLLINGIIQKEDTTIGETYKSESEVTYPFIVPKECVFVLGDNREVALDSRYLGTINNNNLIGKVIFEIKIVKN